MSLIHCKACGETHDQDRTCARPPLAGRTGSGTAEEWWIKHATLLAEKMRLGGVRKFRVELTPRGTYEFEVDPIESPNAQRSATGAVEKGTKHED